VEALGAPMGSRLRLALRITGNASDAEEVVQDALWTASRKIDPSGGGRFGSGVPVTANAAYQKLRGGAGHDVSWDDLSPAVDEQGQHAEVASDCRGGLQRPRDRR